MTAGVMTAILAGCALSKGQSRQPPDVSVPLTDATDLANALGGGLSNIFLDSLTGPTRDSVRMPATWTGAALDDLFSSKELRSVRILRFRTSGDTALKFAVDTVGDLDFRRAAVLTFERQGKLLLANIALTVHSRTGSKRRVAYQILRSEDRYTYARIAEYRTGTVNVDGRAYAVRVRSANRGNPFYTASTGTTFLIDMNADGEFAERASVTVGGRPVAAEQAVAGTPFELAGRFYEVAAIDSAGTTLRIRASNQTVAVAQNRRAPEFRATALDGSTFQLSRQQGKVVLISFWATDCAYSERARSAVNDLVRKYGSKFTWVAMAKDTSRAGIATHLQNSPMSGIVTLPDSVSWTTYNPIGATPVFVIVDGQGMVRFRAEGLSSMSAVAAKLDELLVGH